jgi:hypothetical protein
MMDDGDCEAIVGMKIGKETEVLGENLLQRHFCPPKIPHEQTRVRTRPAVVGSQRLTARATARPALHCTYDVVRLEPFLLSF